MSSVEHIENPDVILIGSGVMSATLGGVLKNLQPDLKIQLYEVTPSWRRKVPTAGTTPARAMQGFAS